MSLENTKIMSRVLMLGKKLKAEIDKTLTDAAKKYEMDLTKSAITFSGNLIKDRIDNLIYEEAIKFKFIRILVDYGACESELNTIKEVTNMVKNDLLDDLPKGADISNFNLVLEESMKLLIIEIPSSWGVEFVEEFKKSLIETLRQKDIVKY